MSEIEQVTTVAKGISEYGILVMIAAVYLVISLSMFIIMMRWFKKSVDRMLSATIELKEISDTIKQTNSMMDDIAEGLLPETQLRIKNTSNVYFDLATEKVCRLIKRIREENHIADKEATRIKIRTLLQNMYNDRNSRFDSYTYRGKKISSYCNPEWVEWVGKVVENELYNKDGANNGRAYTNVKSVYEKIKLDFYHKMNNV